VPEVFAASRAAFREVFGRDPGAAIQTWGTEDADRILVATGSIATTARRVVEEHREAGERVGLVKIKLFRPFPGAELARACAAASKIGVLDRNYAAGVGGVFCQDLRAAFQGRRDDVLIQDYLTGVCGGDVTPHHLDSVLADLALRGEAQQPVWIGIDGGEEAN
jgi:pyruvate ferredoxin oxidoreductase alpha subunit